MENDTVYALFFQWDSVKDWGLLFSLLDWKVTLYEINTLSLTIFGKTFYNLDKQGINLIALHDVFLDFIDLQREKNPEKLIIFLEWLKTNPLTSHMLSIIKKAMKSAPPKKK